MEETIKKIEKMIQLMGFKESQIDIDVDEEHRKVSIKIDDEAVRGKITPKAMSALNLIINQLFKKKGIGHHVVDLNYYRKERERLITELARAAAKKATVTKENVELPAMNSYERRLVHMEIATHPQLETESVGQGKERRVVVKLLE